METKKTEEDELKEFLHTEKKEESRDAKIFFDGKQYNLRIPKKFAEVMELSYNKKLTEFLFEFTLERPPAHAESPHPQLKGVLKIG